ncbi:ribonuclease H-like protein [Phlegmacium glaucopus]|nr:ribonuclease H-like protein [Phlegmacium glaucopus]
MSLEQPQTSLDPWEPPKIDKSPPRPAPTKAYSWQEYNSLAKMLYIRDHQQANEELSKLNATVLGFDLEWKPTFYRGGKENRVALVQLANHDTILLLQISAMQEFPSKLAEILSNPDVVKAGVAIQNDAKKFYNDYRVSIYNCVDLSLFARTVDNARWQGKYDHPLGLARLIESYEYRLLDKGKITRSNWEAMLSEAQQEYASNDAHAGLILYRKFETLLPLLPTHPKRMWYSFDVVDGQLCQPDGTRWHAFNPDYDPGPPPPPRLPREVKASMIITTESNGEASSATKARRNDNRSQPYRPRWPERNPHLAPSTSQQSPAVGASGSTQQLRPQGQRTYGNNPQSLSKNSGHILSQHQPAGAQRGSPAQWRVASSGLSSNIGNDLGQPIEQAQVRKSYPKRPPHRKSSYRPHQPGSQDANNS